MGHKLEAGPEDRDNCGHQEDKKDEKFDCKENLSHCFNKNEYNRHFKSVSRSEELKSFAVP